MSLLFQKTPHFTVQMASIFPDSTGKVGQKQKPTSEPSEEIRNGWN